MMEQLADRTLSYGQERAPSLVDKFGVWLSTRQIRRFVPDWRGKRAADFGCGYHASILRAHLDDVASAVLVDVALSPTLKQNPKVRAIEGGLPDALAAVPAASLDIVLCTSVLEHLWEPALCLAEIRRVLAPGGLALLNVPSWRGKRFLEFSAFRLHTSPASEMDDHKMYYDVGDFWPLLVRAGFKPSRIQCFTHKFGLNVFAACRAGD